MNEDHLAEVRAKISSLRAMMKEAIDSSLPLLDGRQEKELITLWQNFFGEMLGYIRQKGRGKRTNLLLTILLSFNRAWFRP